MITSSELRQLAEIRAKKFAKTCRKEGIDIKAMKPVDILALGIFYGWKTSEPDEPQEESGE